MTSDWVGRILVACLIGLYVLLPLDRGFPTIPLFGRPLNAAVAATLSVLLVLIVQSRGAVLAYLREPYCILQSLYTAVLVAGALRAPSPLSALHWTALYYCTFVLNYVVLRHMTRTAGRQWLSTVVVALGLAAAAVGILQGLAGLQLPMYDTWFRAYSRVPPPDYSLATTRAHGTMGNPVLYSVLMALVVPYALDIGRAPIRAVALYVILLAAGLSGSRTAMIVVVFAIGALVVFRWAAVRAMPIVAVGLLALAASLGSLTPKAQDSRLTRLVERFDLSDQSKALLNADAKTTAAALEKATAEGPKGESNSHVSAALGISLRRGAVTEGFREMTQEWGALTWFVGRGSLTSPAIGMRLQPWYNTVDNVFLSVLYERGLIGLSLFLCVFLSILIATRRAALNTVHWYAPLALALTGLSFCWDAYSMFNILAVGSMAIAMRHHEERTAA